MDIRFTNRWCGFNMKELERMLWMTEYYVNQDDLTFDLRMDIEHELKKRGVQTEDQPSDMFDSSDGFDPAERFLFE